MKKKMRKGIRKEIEEEEGGKERRINIIGEKKKK